MVKNKIILFLLVVLSAGLIITPVYGVSIQDVSTEETIPGGQITVSVNSSDTGVIAIRGIPVGWEIDRFESDGGIAVREDGNDDGHNESIGWAWLDIQETVNPSVTLNVPSDEDPGDYTIQVSAIEQENQTDITNVTLTVQNPQDTTNTDQNTTGNNNQDGNQTQPQPGFTILAGLIAISSIYIYRIYN